MKRIFTFKHALVWCLCFGMGIAYSQTYTFTHCGATGQDGPTGPEITAEYEGTDLEGLVTGISGIQYWTVPSTGEYSIEAWGAEGGADGGLGARMYGEFLLTEGQEIKILVGQEGGSSDGLHGSGGGGSFVVLAADDTPLVVAGGGGGHGKTAPGISDEADGTTSTAGQNPGGGGPGGTDGGGGAAASGDIGGTRDTPGQDASGSTWSSGGGGFYTAGGGMNSGDIPGGQAFVDGGQGGDLAFTDGEWPGGFGGGGGVGDRGAGGGGYSGGGGGEENTVGGGGGGSFNDGINQDNEGGVRSGNGLVEITILCSPLTITVTDYDPCINEYITLTADSETGGITTWEDGIESGVPFIPGGPGSYFYTANSTNPDDCGPTIEIVVHGFPDVVANVTPTEICEGESAILYGSGADTYEWSPGDVDDRDVIYPSEGTITYTCTGTDIYGCVSDDEVTLTVYPAPTLTITADNTVICQGDEVTLTASGGVEYDWDSPVINGVPFTIDAIGSFTYEVEMEDENGCEVEDEITITVGAPIEITYTTIEELLGDDGSIDITVTGGTAPYTFDWDNDGTGDFDDPEDLTDIGGGTYEVVVNDAGTCSKSEMIIVDSQLGINTNNSIDVNVFPNPFVENLTIQIEGEFNYEIVSTLGQTILLDKCIDQTVINVKDLAKGSYFLTINSNENTKTIKLIKQ